MSNPKTIQPSARYEGAGRGRRLANWNPPSTGPVSATNPALQTLKDRTRDLVRNDAIAASAVRVLVNSIVGFGIQCRSLEADKAKKKQLTDLWTAWTKHASTDGADFYALQAIVVRALVSDGEAFIRIRPRKPIDGLTLPMQLQPLESDMLPLLNADQWPGLPAGHRIIQGVEFDQIDNRVAYWFYRQHPGERFNTAALPDELTRVPAESVLHIYEPHRIGAVRGVSPFAPIITKLKNVSDYDDAVIERMKLSNLFAGFVTRPMPSGDNDPLTGMPAEVDDTGAPLAGLEPGLLQELLPGEDVTFSAPPDAGTAYSEFMRHQYLTIGAALGVPAEMLTGELRDISDRTLRFGIGEFRRRVEQIVWTVLVPRFLAPARDAWVLAAVLAGAIKATDATTAQAVTWAIQAHPAIHPTQDLQAMKMAVDNGFRSRSSVIAAFGDDPEAVDAERAVDAARTAALGLQTSDEQLAAAEVAKLEAEAAAAEKAAQAATATASAAKAKAQEAKASADALKAQQRTADESRPYDLAVAKDRAKAARIELRAVESDLKQIMGRTA